MSLSNPTLPEITDGYEIQLYHSLGHDPIAPGLCHTFTIWPDRNSGAKYETRSVMHEILPNVSVGIPTYNRPDYLEARIKNVLRQTSRNFEIIISDNCSPDPKVQAIGEHFARLDSRVRYIRQSHNIGAGANFLFVLEQARAPLFVWAADDDEWHENYLEVCAKNIGSAQLFCPSMEILFLETGERRELELPDLSAPRGTVANLPKFLCNTQPSMVYGLHKTDALKTFTKRELKYDLWDVALLYHAVVNLGITVGTGTVYSAGIEGAAYQIKTFGRRGSEDKLSYRGFIGSTVLSTLQSRQFPGFKAKMRALVLLLKMSSDLIIHLRNAYPERSRAHHRLLELPRKMRARYDELLARLSSIKRRFITGK
ncbi:glycosyltransferase family 2 protein [Rhizobium sp. NPDC090275]|uniref:glycosyltransferase family 2 protein n=1 Tax=Rhizobium sp. NPDC090275 TaxID=3364498 RepID=UPI00383B3236